MRPAFTIIIFSIYVEMTICAHGATACQAITNDTDRLKCYDDAFGVSPHTETASTKKPDASTSERWGVNITNDNLTKKPKVILSIESESASIASDRRGKEAVSTLIIRCTNKNVELIFSFDGLVANASVSANYRIGNHPPRRVSWSASQNHEAFGPWGTSEAKSMIKEMLDSDDLYVRSDTRIFSSTEALFRLSGFKTAISSSMEVCGIH